MREVQLEALSQALVDGVGVEKAIQILNEANDLLRLRYPGSRISPDYIGMAGYAKMYGETKKHEGRK